MHNTAPLLIVIGLLVTASPAAGNRDDVLSRYEFGRDSMSQWKLPGKLREISGLVFHDGRLFGHDDQLGIVYELDYRAGRLDKAFALGRKTVRGDFEGIAAVGDTFYLVTSDGRIFYAREGGNGERVPYDSYYTGLGHRCEIEGLVYDPGKHRLLLVCKEARIEALKKHIAIFSWSLEQQRLIEDETIMVKRSSLARRIRGKRFNPSGIEIDPRTGHLLLVAARQRAIAEISVDGEVVDAFELPLAGRHRQTEGIALTAEAELILADEGGSKKARLAIYRPRP